MIARTRGRWVALVAGILVSLVAMAVARASDAPTLVIDRALTATTSDGRFPGADALSPIALPDDWADSRPGYDGSIWYRAGFRLGGGAVPDDLLALYVERACSNLQVQLNGALDLQRRPDAGAGDAQLLAAAADHAAAGAARRAQDNVLDLRVYGHPLERVASRQAAGGLSRIELGLQSTLAPAHAARTFCGARVDRGEQPDPDRPRLRPARGRLAATSARSTSRTSAGSASAGLVPTLVSHARDLPWGNERHASSCCARRWAVLLALRGPVLPQLRRPALAHDREPRRPAMGGCCRCR